MYNKSDLTFYYQFPGNLGIFYCRGTYIFIIRITFPKKADTTICVQYNLLSIPVIKSSCYQWLYPAIHCKEYDKITMINETRQNIVVLTINIFAVYYKKQPKIWLTALSLYFIVKTGCPPLRTTSLVPTVILIELIRVSN